jgi:ubiquinone biosynthesis protein Coq4
LTAKRARRYQIRMVTRDALARYFERRGIKPEAESIDEWLRENWAYMNVRGHRIPIKPLYGYKHVVILHDVHHLLTGYETTWTGEMEVAAWELGSGGCGPHWLMWGNRLFSLLLGLLTAPRATVRAFRRGRAYRNLYHLDCHDVLRSHVEDLQRYVAAA